MLVVAASAGAGQGRARPRPVLIRGVPRTPLPLRGSLRGSLRSKRWVCLRGVGPGKHRPSLLSRAGSPDRFGSPGSLRSLPRGGRGPSLALTRRPASQGARLSCAAGDAQDDSELPDPIAERLGSARVMRHRVDAMRSDLRYVNLM